MSKSKNPLPKEFYCIRNIFNYVDRSKIDKVFYYRARAINGWYNFYPCNEKWEQQSMWSTGNSYRYGTLLRQIQNGILVLRDEINVQEVEDIGVMDAIL